MDRTLVAKGVCMDHREVNSAGGTPALPIGPRGWYSRGYLPHFDGGEIHQAVTFRLADSFPASRLRRGGGSCVSCPHRPQMPNCEGGLRSTSIAAQGSAFLRRPAVAEMVQQSLLFFDGDRYRLTAWTIMPNHVHVLFLSLAGHTLASILQAWKSYTAKEANKMLRRSGQFWQEDYYDRFIRNDDHYLAEIVYIEENPVTAGLCKSPAEWPYGSARFRIAGVPPDQSAGVRPHDAREGDAWGQSSGASSGRDARAPAAVRQAGGTPNLRLRRCRTQRGDARECLLFEFAGGAAGDHVVVDLGRLRFAVFLGRAALLEEHGRLAVLRVLLDRVHAAGLGHAGHRAPGRTGLRRGQLVRVPSPDAAGEEPTRFKPSSRLGRKGAAAGCRGCGAASFAAGGSGKPPSCDCAFSANACRIACTRGFCDNADPPPP